MNKAKTDNAKDQQVLLITASFGCNSNCVMCSVQNLKKTPTSAGTLIQELRTGSEQGYGKVEFTGGEPTIRKDLPLLVSTARTLGYVQVGISTNGRMLADKEFCERMFESGLNQVSVSLYGDNAKLHDAVTRCPGSFVKTVQGIKNALTHPGVPVTVCTTVMGSNYKNLLKVGAIVNTLGVKNWHVSDLIPDGRGKRNYKSLAVDSLTGLSDNLNSLAKITGSFNEITFFGFPPCFLSSRLRRMPQVHFVMTKDKPKIHKKLVPSLRVYKKECVAACADCVFNDSCDGIWKDYLRLRGIRKTDTETKLLVSRNICYRKVRTGHI